MRKVIKYAGTMMVCLLAVFLLRMPVMAADVPSTAWRDYAATEFAGGTGTAEDPYLISDAAQLAKLAKDVEQGTNYANMYLRLENNIDLSEHRWNPIGIYRWYRGGATDTKTFAGFLDGNGMTITGLIVDERIEKNSAGLFGNIGDDVRKSNNVGVENLTITDATIFGCDEGLTLGQSSILAGWVMANSGYTVQFDNIHVSGKIVNNWTSSDSMISGGLLGNVNRATVSNCTADVTIENGDNSGGFVGMDCGSTYTNCKVSGQINGLWSIGGFAGYVVADSTYMNCIADVNVVGNDWHVGGFVGYAEGGKFSACAALGNVESTVDQFDPKVGGFAGESAYNNVEFEKCHSAGKVTSASTDFVAGGFMGSYTTGTFTDCSFDSEKNAGLQAFGEGDSTSVDIQAGSTADVSGNLCEDIYGGHIWNPDYTVDLAPTCGVNGSESIHCSRCDSSKDAREIPATGAHQWQWVIDREAAVGVEGSKHEECTVCHATQPVVAIPALSDTTPGNGETGESNPGGGTNAGNNATNNTASNNNTNPTGNNTTQTTTAPTEDAGSNNQTDTSVMSPKTGEMSDGTVYIVLFASLCGMAVLLRKRNY